MGRSREAVRRRAGLGGRLAAWCLGSVSDLGTLLYGFTTVSSPPSNFRCAPQR